MVPSKVPFKDRYFEDFVEGETAEFGDYLVTEREILEFAKQYDPQPFHLDAKAAELTIYGGLIASGWMTASIGMRLLVDNVIAAKSSMGSPGVDELRWLLPTRPGDRLSLRISIIKTRRSQSKPDRGTVEFFEQMLNQNKQVIMTVRGLLMLRCKP